MRSTTAVDAQHLYISKRVGYQSKKIIASLSAFKKSAQFINSLLIQIQRTLVPH